MKRKTVQVPHDGTGIVKKVAEVWARIVGNDDEIDIPTGWAHVANDENGDPLYGWVGPPWRRPELEALAEALRKRNG